MLQRILIFLGLKDKPQVDIFATNAIEIDAFANVYETAKMMKFVYDKLDAIGYEHKLMQTLCSKKKRMTSHEYCSNDGMMIINYKDYLSIIELYTNKLLVICNRRKSEAKITRVEMFLSVIIKTTNELNSI